MLSAFKITMTEATKFIGASSASLSELLKGVSPFTLMDSIARLRLPYSCRTPLGLPVVPEV